MERFRTLANDQMVTPLSTFYQNNTKLSNVLLTSSLIYFVHKGYKKWRSQQKIHVSREEINNKAILITGCGHGFGHTLALKLSIDLGYRVIATCRTQESIKKLKENMQFTQNKSTAFELNVADNSNIENVEKLVTKYLNETDSVLWGIVNNAGFDTYTPFECTPISDDKLERDVLLNGPIHICRTFLPLLQGRKNYNINFNRKLEYSAEGGRIVNVSSAAARFCIGNVRYGVCKAALSYFSHGLRRELSPRFGIWCSVIEPAGFKTNAKYSCMKRTEDIVEDIKQSGKKELLDIYDFDLNVLKERIDKFVNDNFSENYDIVIDDMIHALTAKYPKREYVPGGNIMSTIMEYLPMWMFDSMVLMGDKQMAAKAKKERI